MYKFRKLIYLTLLTFENSIDTVDFTTSFLVWKSLDNSAYSVRDSVGSAPDAAHINVARDPIGTENTLFYIHIKT